MRLRLDPFIGLLLASAALGVLLPATGTALSVVTVISQLAVAVLFFLHGARLPTQEVWRGLIDWRVHAVILAITFLVFPAIGFGIAITGDLILPRPVVEGLVYVTLVPSTVQSAVAFTSIARGDRSIAVVAASVSSVIGVVATPVLVSVMLGSNVDITWQSIVRIIGLLLVPFVLGQWSRRLTSRWTSGRESSWVQVDHVMVLFVVYVGFSHGTNADVWSALGWTDFATLVGVVVAVLAVAATVSWSAGRPFGRDRRIAVFFAGTNKSLAAGLPMALVLFPESTFGLAILPLMIYHQSQLLLGAFLSSRWGAHAD